MGRGRTRTRPGHVYRSVREKQGHVVYRQRVLQIVTSLRVVSLVGSLRKDNEEGNENGKKAIGLDKQTTTLHVHHAFLYISLPSLHDFNAKLPKFTFGPGREQKTTTFFSFS